MRKIEVVAAIILFNNKIFACQRGYGAQKGGWEFPGGKIEKDETHQNALKREIKEELNVEIEIGNLVKTIEFDYPEFHLTMHCYRASIVKGEITLLEHLSYKWLVKDDLYSVNWLPADIELLEDIEKLLN